MHGADARAGEHRNEGLGHERHVDRDAVALRDAQPFQRVGEQADLSVQLQIGAGPNFAGLAFPYQRGLVATRAVEMTVEAVVGEIGGGCDEPLRVGNLPLKRLSPRRTKTAPARRRPQKRSGNFAAEASSFARAALPEISAVLAKAARGG